MKTKKVKSKTNLPGKPLLELAILLVSGLFIFVFQIFFSNLKTIYKSKAQTAGKTLTVCTSGCTYTGGTGLQQAVDAATDGDTIVISGGTYSGTNSSPFPNGRMNVQSCFVDLKGKSLTIQGAGATLFGQGHQIGTHDASDPYYHRTGICSSGGTVVIDGLRIKEFEGGAMQFFNTRVVLKNTLIDGNDHGAVFLFDSPILAVNNNFVRNIALMPFRDSPIKAYNNTFFESKAIVAAISCNDNVPEMDFVNNIVVDEELTIGIGGLSSNCPEKVSQFKTKHIAYNLQWKKGHGCYPHEYCDTYTGLVNADPKYDICTEPGGLCGGSLDPKESVFGLGDPTVPGKKDLGPTGGPCEVGASSVCTQFISQFLVSSVPTSTPVPTDTGYPTSSLTPSPSVTITSTISPTPTVVTPTPTLGATDMRLNLKLKFQGVTTKPQDLYNLMKVKVTVQKKSAAGTGKTSNLTADSSGIWSGSVIFSQITDGSDYQLFIKGPKHLQRKICNNSPTETTPGTYKCDSSSGISLKLGENNLDFSGLYLFAGDLNQDGIVDSTDVSGVRTSLGKTDSQSLTSCDLNNDGVCDTQDFSLVIGALRVRFDDEK